MNSRRSGFEDGRKGRRFGGGTTVKPSEKRNWWYGLNNGSGRTSVSLALETDKGGMSSNCLSVWLVAGYYT